MNELQEFLSTVKESPAQRTPEWYALKALTIGGSEVSCVVGSSPYKNVKDLIKEKLGLSYFGGNTACRWGTLFEHLTATCTSSLLHCTIHECGSVEGPIKGQRYSPDGVAVCKLINIANKRAKYFVLFEFKSPISGMPNDKIPKHYLPQIHTGLISIPADFCIFVNCCFRKCSMKNLDFTMTYDEIYHRFDINKKTVAERRTCVFAHGVIEFYQTKESYEEIRSFLCSDNELSDYIINYNSIDDDILYNSANTPLDFGELSTRYIDRLLELVDKKRVTYVYRSIIFNTDVIHEFSSLHKLKPPIDVSNNVINENILIGVLPWKLLKFDIIVEEAKPMWKETIEAPITETLNIIKKCIDSDDKEIAFYEHFPVETSYGEFDLTL
jgi:hypothetical protein